MGKFIGEGKVVKSNLLPIPPVFRLIQRESKADYKEMFQVFNMGQRLECYCLPEVVEDILQIAKAMNIDAQITGEVIPANSPSVEIHFEGLHYNYGE